MTQNKDWIDNLKLFGIVIIVLGHVGLDLKEYFKPNSLEALGVGPFFLILGYNLAKSRKGKCELVVSRLFKLYVWGGIAAVLDSSLDYFIHNNFGESNFLPFIFGINSFFVGASVPGNPVLWFVGAYSHFVFLFVLLKKVPIINLYLITLFIILEVILRMFDGLFYDSYTLFLNWMSIFLLGIYFYQNEERLSNKILDNKYIAIIGIGVLTPGVLILLNGVYPVVAEGFRFIYVTIVLLILSVILRSTYIGKLIASGSLFIFLFHHIIVDYLPQHVPVYIIIAESCFLLISLSIIARMLADNKIINGLQNRLIVICKRQ